MEEVALRLVFVMVDFHAPGELIDGFGKMIQTLVQRVELVLIAERFRFEEGFKVIDCLQR
jgi:hypothetical protein